jgi:hypothetical protein
MVPAQRVRKTRTGEVSALDPVGTPSKLYPGQIPSARARFAPRISDFAVRFRRRSVLGGIFDLYRQIIV